MWTFCGHALKPSDFTGAMLRLYRGEVDRSNTWRMRLDNTSNWAMAVTGAAVVLTFSGFGVHHSVVSLMTLLVT
jgi:uncharacterized membrane protein